MDYVKLILKIKSYFSEIPGESKIFFVINSCLFNRYTPQVPLFPAAAA